jgi:putative addiction module component (TIGR02574 family)
MSIDTTKLLNDALSLPAEARAALAAKLIESLDETVDPDAEARWAEEIRRRLKEIDEGQVQGVPWSKVRASIVRR